METGECEMKKWLIIGGLLVLVVGGSGWYFLSNQEAQTVEAAIQTATAEMGNMEVEITGSGSVTAITDQDITASNTILVVDSVSVEIGDYVYKGNTLVTFANGDTVTAPYSGEITEVSIESGSGATEGTILVRMKNSDGYVQPVTRGTSSTTTTGGGSLIVDTVHVKEGDTVEAGATLVTFTDGSLLKASVGGTLTSLAVKNGDSVQSGGIVGHVTDFHTLQTTISVDELDITKVQAGQAVEIIASAFEGEVFQGTVANVSTVGTSSNGISTFDVTIQITDPKNLKIGMSTEASILIESKENALYVPVAAVYSRGEEKYVLVPSSTEESSEGTRVTVETGIANDSYVEIVSGLSEGDTVQLPGVTSSGTAGQGGMMMPGSGFQGGGTFPAGDRGGMTGGGNRGTQGGN